MHLIAPGMAVALQLIATAAMPAARVPNRPGKARHLADNAQRLEVVAQQQDLVAVQEAVVAADDGFKGMKLLGLSLAIGGYRNPFTVIGYLIIYLG